MKPKRILGVIFLLMTLTLVILMSAKLPNLKTRKFSIDNPVAVPSGPNNFYNLTLEPLGKEDYHVEIIISPVNSSIQVDFWAVNTTWLGPLIEFVYIDFLQLDYPYGRPFDLIKTYAKEINITSLKRFELTGLDYNGAYCFVLINFFENTQHVSINIEERYVEPPTRPLIEPNPASLMISAVVAVAGTYLLVASSKRSTRKARRRLS